MSPRGPKNPDDFRVMFRNSRHYWDPLPACDLRPEGPMPVDGDGEPIKRNALPAQSTIMKSIPSDALLYWAVGQTATYAVDEREKWEKLDRDDAVDILKKAHRKASGKAADRGTDVHGYLEAKLAGRPGGALTMNPDAKKYLRVVDAFIAEQKPELVLSEVVGISDAHGVTTDAILRLPEFGDVLNVLDWKTRNDTVKKPHVVYEKEVAQLGANLDLRYWIVEDDETGEASRLALPDGLGAVLVTFTTTEYAIHRMKKPEEAIAGFRDVLAWHEAMKRLPKAAEKPLIFALPAPKPSLVREAVLDALADEETVLAQAKAELVEQGVPPEEADRLLEGATVDGEGRVLVDPGEPCPEPDVVDVDDLRKRIEKIVETDEHFEHLRTIWPVSTGLSDAPLEDLPAIRRAVELTEAKFGYPFDPPPSEPVESRFTSKPEPVEQTEPKPDEGPDVGDEDVDTVRKSYGFLEAAGRTWIEDVAKRTGNLSISEKPSARRARIGFALCRLAVAGWHDDELLAAVLDHAQILTSPVEDPAPVLAELSAAHAKRLSDVVGELVEDRLTFSVSPETGRMRLEAA